MTHKFIKPSRAGLVVRDHKSNFAKLEDSGKEVVWDTTWAKRLRDGDVVEVIAERPAPIIEQPKSKLSLPIKHVNKEK